VILAKTVKGYGMGVAGEGKNITHSQKKMGEQALKRLPRPLPHPHFRRPAPSRAVLQTGGRQPGNQVPARNAAPRWAAICRSAAAPPNR
jgi:pyruvate dehydrogenase E1 component